MIIKLLTEEDLEWARQLHNDPDVLCMLTDPTVVTPEQQEKWFASLQNSSRSDRLVIWNNEQERVGIARIDDIDRHNHSVCIGLDIHKDHRGKGYAKKIYRTLIKKYFDENMNRIWLIVASYNFVAFNLYLKLGFSIEGVQRKSLYKNGKYHDAVMMSILRSEYDTSL